MGLFDSQFARVEDFLAKKRANGELREFSLYPARDWPQESSLILEEDAALELGNPAMGSLSFLVWREEERVRDSRILLVGPDFAEIIQKSAPLAQIILVSGSFPEEYECFRELRDAVFDVKLKGLMTRVLPSRQTLWARVDREALDRCLSLAHLGSALIEGLLAFDFVRTVTVVFVTSGKADLDALERPALESARIVGAMMKMNEEMNFECESCEFWDVCESVAELKKIRRRLHPEEPR